MPTFHMGPFFLCKKMLPDSAESGAVFEGRAGAVSGCNELFTANVESASATERKSTSRPT